MIFKNDGKQPRVLISATLRDGRTVRLELDEADFMLTDQPDDIITYEILEAINHVEAV